MAYINNILIYSENPQQHQGYIKEVLIRLKTTGLQVDITKNKFFIQETKFLGFIISTQGIRINPEKIKIILN